MIDMVERQHLTGGLAQAGQCFAGKIGMIFVGNFFVGIELETTSSPSRWDVTCNRVRTVQPLKKM